MASPPRLVFAGKKFLIFHYRVGKTDGVSLEISAWSEILKAQGDEVFLCAGPESRGADYTVKFFENQLNPEIYRIDEEAFQGFRPFAEEKSFISELEKYISLLEGDFNRVVQDRNAECLKLLRQFGVEPDDLVILQATRVVRRKNI